MPYSFAFVHAPACARFDVVPNVRETLVHKGGGDELGAIVDAKRACIVAFVINKLLFFVFHRDRERRSLNDRSKFTRAEMFHSKRLFVAVFREHREIYHRATLKGRGNRRNNVSYRICAYIYYYRRIEVINDSMNFINRPLLVISTNLYHRATMCNHEPLINIPNSRSLNENIENFSSNHRIMLNFFHCADEVGRRY